MFSVLLKNMYSKSIFSRLACLNLNQIAIKIARLYIETNVRPIKNLSGVRLKPIQVPNFIAEYPYPMIKGTTAFGDGLSISSSDPIAITNENLANASLFLRIARIKS